MVPRKPFHRVIDGVPRCAWIVDPDTYRESQKFRAEKNDLIQSTYPKSGTYWVQYITQLILKGGEPVVTYDEFTSHTHGLEYMKHDDWKPQLPMRLFFTHLPLRKETMSAKAKYVYVARNPWDVCVSFYHMMTDVSVWNFQDGTFDEFLYAFLETDLGYGSYFDHVASGYALKEETNMFFVTYEEMKRGTRATVLRLAHFLGEHYGNALEKNERLLQNILHWSSPSYTRNVLVIDFHENKNTVWKTMFHQNKMSCKRGHEGNKNMFPMVRTAKIGGWKEYFSREQLARLEMKIQEEGGKASFIDLWKDIREEANCLIRGSPFFCESCGQE